MMGLFKKKNDDATPLQQSVRELEEIDKELESGEAIEDEERQRLLDRREELETEIAHLRGEAPPTPREDIRPADVEEEHLTKMR